MKRTEKRVNITAAVTRAEAAAIRAAAKKAGKLPSAYMRDVLHELHKSEIERLEGAYRQQDDAERTAALKKARQKLVNAALAAVCRTGVVTSKDITISASYDGVRVNDPLDPEGSTEHIPIWEAQRMVCDAVDPAVLKELKDGVVDRIHFGGDYDGFEVTIKRVEEEKE